MTPPPSPETIDRVTGVIELFTTARRIDPRALLGDDLGFGWLDRMNLGCELDTTFTIAIPDREVSDWDTVEDVARTVDRLLSRERRR
ncbi:acyl carrier protein [Novosphingobium mangrovi (ex Huang et al. 2023)]|uniref:Acyl carrier protein n=1 Tax=Novosphingobium mangrovi (ex Huang et al. 2023) TaxID=2976432 RepID=A0ABT2I109_9SPHN|nr:acyl carrier protein [Novosphingobium mangrovi (ex Huang et al. 2023)]MCT2398492.1 acyl carrier protein [Novosphingobium mangrovi (ex Huang et al. 2023)]